MAKLEAGLLKAAENPVIDRWAQPLAEAVVEVLARKDDVDALLVRQHRRVCGLAHPCGHMGGPLSEGTLKDGSVVCPWHGSEFALQDGRVMNGPATRAQPTFKVRERNGSIEVKARG